MNSTTMVTAGALPSQNEMLRAFLSSDASYDGVFYTAVRTTGIFCRPSCSARKPREENVSFYGSVNEALFAGYRPCKRCRPLEAAAAVPAWAAELIARTDASPETRMRAGDLRAMGIDPARARRWFLAHYGLTFTAFCRARRLAGALARIRGGGTIDDAVFDSGFESHSGFREAFARAFGAPPGRHEGARAVAIGWVETPLGPMVAGAEDRGVCLLEFSDRRMLEAQIVTLRRRLQAALVPADHPLLDRLKQELAEYFAGTRRDFEVPLHAPGTEFQTQVWDALREIPFGETRSYEQLARAIGARAAVRAVGRANGMNRIAILVPCHRVIGKDGTPVGYGGGLWRKRWLLDHEAKTAGTRLL